MANHTMTEQHTIETLIANQNVYSGLIYDRCGLRGEYRVTACLLPNYEHRVVLGCHMDRRTAYKEAIAYLTDPE